MASTARQPQFRYTQPPSKVIHLRNLPWECTEEELVELGKPFGKVVNTKCNVGANHNQAFIEFTDLNQAIAMISYYSSSSEPAQIATFEKTAGFQALVQFSDSEIASTARSSLDGRSIPRYLLPEHVGVCTLRITFSAHTDLNVKFQSCRSRDYTNLNLPVAPSAIDVTGQSSGQDAMKQESESNVLLASIENMQYAVTIDVLHAVFSTVGFVQKIAIFEKNAGFQGLIQYPDVQTAVIAKEVLEGHCIYDGGFCKLHLTYSRHTDLNVKINNDRGRDYTGRNTAISDSQPSILGPQPIPRLGAIPPPYISIPYQPTPQPAMRWNTGAGAIVRPLSHPHGQIYMHQPVKMPPAVPRGMVQLPGPPMPPQQPYIH